VAFVVAALAVNVTGGTATFAPRSEASIRLIMQLREIEKQIEEQRQEKIKEWVSQAPQPPMGE
jgi:hypothetical protein